MEDDPDFEFSFILAEKLGKTVAEIDEMSAAEFLRWNVYLGRKRQMQETGELPTGG